MEKIKEIEKPPRISLKRSLIIFIGNVIAIYLVSYFGLGVKLSDFDDIMLFVLFISIVNAVLWPILTKILLPFLTLTFGVGALILNGVLMEVFAPLFGMSINGWAIVLLPIAMAFTTTLLSALLTIEDTGSYYRSVFRDAEKKTQH